jgi:hypothetical protein
MQSFFSRCTFRVLTRCVQVGCKAQIDGIDKRIQIPGPIVCPSSPSSHASLFTNVVGSLQATAFTSFLYHHHQHHHVGSINLARRSGGATFGVTRLSWRFTSFCLGVHSITRSRRKAKVPTEQFQSRHGISTRPGVCACSWVPLRPTRLDPRFQHLQDGSGVSACS